MIRCSILVRVSDWGSTTKWQRITRNYFQHLARSPRIACRPWDHLEQNNNNTLRIAHNHTTARTIAATNTDNGVLKSIVKKLGWGSSSKSKLKFSSYYLYESVADQLNYADFFDQFEMPNTFNSWFLITELHVWMLLVRSMAEGPEKNEDGRFMRNTIVEAMWTDVSSRAKKLGAHNPSRVRQQTETLSHQFQAALINYDEGLQGDDKTLAGALWRRFFVRDEACDLQRIELLVHYVRAQMDSLDRLPAQEFIVKPKIQWLPLKKLAQERH